PPAGASPISPWLPPAKQPPAPAPATATAIQPRRHASTPSTRPPPAASPVSTGSASCTRPPPAVHTATATATWTPCWTGLRGMPVPGWLVGEQGILPRSAERFARAAEDQRLNGPFSRREGRDLRRYVAGVPGQPGWVSRGGRPGLRIFPAWLGIRP